MSAAFGLGVYAPWLDQARAREEARRRRVLQWRDNPLLCLGRAFYLIACARIAIWHQCHWEDVAAVFDGLTRVLARARRRP